MTTATLAVDRYSRPIPALKPGIVQTVNTTTGSAALSGFTAYDTIVIRLVASTDSFVSIGPTPVASAATGFFLPAGIPEYFRVDQGTVKVSAIAATSAGAVYITEML